MLEGLKKNPFGEHVFVVRQQWIRYGPNMDPYLKARAMIIADQSVDNHSTSLMASGDERFSDQSEPEESLVLHSRSDLQKIGLETARQCWDEFYIWEIGWCRQQILDLTPWTELQGSEELHPLAEGWKSTNIPMDVDSESTDHTVYVYSPESMSSPLDRIKFQEVKVSGRFEPYPLYESCPPSSKNMRRVSNFPEEFQCLFIPYADEPEFNATKYTREKNSEDGYCTFHWQEVWRDPDCEYWFCSWSSSVLTPISGKFAHEDEVIGLETARRLHFGHHFSFAEIDELECFASHDSESKPMFHQLRLSRNDGLLSDVQKRLVIPA